MLAVLLAALALPVALQEPAPAAGLGSLELRLREPIRTGKLRVALHSDPATFAQGGPPAVGAVFGPGEPLVLAEVPPGDYALIVHHDADGDGVLARNFLSIPTEPLGFARGYQPRGRPLFERSRVSLRPGEALTEEVALRAPLGDFGALGVGVGAVVQGLPYRGASGALIQPIPVATYLGRDIAWFGPQLQYAVARYGAAQVAATVRARFPAYEERDAEVLRGLGDRDLVALFGVQTDLDLGADWVLRLGYEHDAFDTVGGGEATAALRRRIDRGALSLTPSLGLRYTAQDLVAHDFGVPLEFATAERSAYRPGDSLALELGLNARVELSERWQLLFNVTAQRFDGEVTDSPLVEDDVRISGIVGLVYTF